MTFKRNKEVELEVLKRDFPDVSISEYEGKKIKYKGGIPGQTVKVRFQRSKKDYVKAKLVEVVEKSKLETNKPCPRYKECGGCDYQTLSYGTELILKLRQIKDLFEKNGLNPNILSINRNPKQVGYRNKMEYTFGDEIKDGELVLGLHMKNMFYSIVDIRECNIVDDDFNRIREYTMLFFRERNIPYYNKMSKEGYLRHLIVRKSHRKNELLINLVTTSQIDKLNFSEEKLLEDYLNGFKILPLEGKLKSFFHTINDSLSDAVVPEEVIHLWGEDHITEIVNGLEFNLGPFSFFQPNVFTQEKLYDKIVEYAGNIGGKLVYDLYCGTGTITQIMAKRASKVVGIEINEEAVRKAYENSNLNGLYNIEYLRGDVLEEIDKLKEEVDIVTIDPPRAGIHKDAIKKIMDMDAKEIIYVSCNPKTLVEDLKIFEEKYEVKKAELFDQFTRTKHIEALTLLSRD